MARSGNLLIMGRRTIRAKITKLRKKRVEEELTPLLFETMNAMDKLIDKMIDYIEKGIPREEIRDVMEKYIEENFPQIDEKNKKIWSDY